MGQNSWDDSDDLYLRLAGASQLVDEELLYEGIDRVAPYGLWICGPDGELLRISSDFLDLLGLTLEDCQNFNWWAKLPADEAAALQSAWQHAVIHNHPFKVEHEVCDRRGVRHAIAVRSVPVRDRNGQVCMWVGFIRDIDHVRQQEALIRESEARFRSVADEAPVLIWMSGEDGVTNYFNRQWVSVTGASLRNLERTGFEDLLHPLERERVLRELDLHMQTHNAFEMKFRLRLADGSYATMLNHATPRRLDSGRFGGYIGSVVDVSAIDDSTNKLARLQERFELAAEASDAVVYDFDLTTHWVEITGATQSLFSLAGSSMTLSQWLSCLAEPDQARFLTLIGGTQPRVEWEYLLTAYDGSKHLRFDKGLLHFNSKGVAVRLVVCSVKSLS